MKTYLFPLTLVLLMFLACSKSDETANSILLQEYTTPIEVRTIDDFQKGGSPGSSSCIPSEKDTSIFLDLNSDGVDDYEIYGSHKNESCGHGSGAYVTYSAYTKIKGLNGVNLIGTNGSYLLYDIIDGNTFQSGYEIYFNLYSGCTGAGINGYDTKIRDGYIGVVSNDQFGWIQFEHVENRGIAIKGHAINRTIGKGIQAGQIE